MKETRTLKELEEQINNKGEQIDAVRYALRLAEKKHHDAEDMVQNVPTNIYIEDWKREEKYTAKVCARLGSVLEQLSKDLDDLCEECEKARQEAEENYYELRPLNHLKTGDYFRKVKSGKATARVWVKQCWDASEKKYLCYAFDDTSDWCYIKGDAVVACGFTF